MLGPYPAAAVAHRLDLELKASKKQVLTSPSDKVLAPAICNPATRYCVNGLRLAHRPEQAWFSMWTNFFRPVTVTLEVGLLFITVLLAILAASATEISVTYKVLLVLLHPAAAVVFVTAAQSRWPLPRRVQRVAVAWLGIYLLVTAGFAAAVATGWTSGHLLTALTSSGGSVEFDLSLTLSERDLIVPATLCLFAAVTFAVLLAVQIHRSQHIKHGL